MADNASSLLTLSQNRALSLEYAKTLMAKASITPEDGGCQPFLIQHLEKSGFLCEQTQVNGVSNLIAKWGTGSLQVAFCGHTDVVPPGPLARWETDPFTPTVENNLLHGRGAADMKTGIAAMLAAVERALPECSPESMTFWWFITSDEEGEAEFGSKWIKETMDSRGIHMDICLVGEPSASRSTGDTIKVGRRGSLSGTIRVTGKQGHVAYPHSCDNAIHKASAIIQQLLAQGWDGGDADFPGTSLQITHLDTGSFTDNLAPGQCRIEFNVRYAAEFNQHTLMAKLQDVISQVDDTADVSWSRPCEAYLTQPSLSPCIIDIAEAAIHNNTGRYPLLSTSGGTSDGRFFASDTTQVIELGVPNTTIHQANERIHLSDLMTLEDIYTDILFQLATHDESVSG